MMFLAVFSLGGLFHDHMVLQRGRSNPVWGTDQPHQVVELTVAGADHPPFTATATTDADGHWRLMCPELPTGGPYELRFRGSAEQVIEDVLVGDVWLASGQSNMAFPVAGTLDAGHEIATANYPRIRVGKVPQHTAASPETDVVLEWKPVTPTDAPSFTAVGYFFARDLHLSQGIPIGIIDASWGGTRVEAWASEDALKAVWPGIYAEKQRIAASLPHLGQIQADYQAALDAWDKTAFPSDGENRGEVEGWASPGFDDHAWAKIALPATVQSAGHADNGVFWFRREIDLPRFDGNADLALHLGAIDDHDRTYFNGELVGATGPETANPHEAQRNYRVPAALLRPGRNTIAVRVFDRFGLGGFMGPAKELFLDTGERRLPLTGEWRWQVERTIPKVPDSIFATQPPLPPELNFPNHAAALYNGMIAPLVPFGLRGFIWYQGESNVGQAADYARHFTALIRDWRGRWGQGQLPFYFVQLAGFNQNNLWPELREAQTRVLSEPETGMAVAIDVGNPTDIHPGNKQDVGHRLALLARARVYGETSIVDRGPTLDQVDINGSEVRVQWRSAAGLHTRDDAPEVLGFALAGADGTYHPARAVIRDGLVVVTSPDVKQPHHVRYAWADCPDTNLVNAADLPAEPFRTDYQ